ncbi:2-amino-4-hydroxy-6-hydroxymethyldihydropteridine diphosphokinase [Rhodovulum sp. MB263]|uniref:2-amino-4-hydroxy-6- hydroxymethyldihydropteridine diphosphokinase n=1 Tax=Rhodovulum sp. (strain MB263) TaxID=308754 RepID=UPI0009B72A15|nr:2-amino-4-hydroxy-6-hydroxymethyldihydropteridine diphosphokinase [Rhodovulum sp. MB263]ARC87368.1 2-amino-4-hydroxy-6-hydroxymethyldihydropteridine diphosphokinase [Rhodovulum sp. MB263]
MPQPEKSIPAWPKGLIALGGNMGSGAGAPEATLAAGLAALEAESVRIVKISRFYHTPSMPEGSGPEFVNAVVEIATDLSATALLARLHGIEARFGRERRIRWAPRTLDLDLLDLDGAVLPDAAVQARWMGLAPEAQAREVPDRTILPHPRIQDRAFVLVPLAEIAPDWRHPVSGQTAQEMLAALPAAEIAGISPFSGPWSGVSALVKTYPSQ